MASTSLSSLARTCSYCLSSLNPAKLLPQSQRAFRSTKSKRQILLPVQLEQALPNWGPKGAYVRVAPGYMRNYLYPRRIARYLVGEELNKLLKSDTLIQRDRTFMDPSKQGVEEPTPQDRDTSLGRSEVVPAISPERTLALLESLGKRKYAFYRRPNPGAASQIPTLESTHGVAPMRNNVPIFGSVSTAEIAQAIKGSVAHNEEAALIVLDADNIRVVSGLGDDADGTRLKALGTYTVEITLGEGLVLNRTVEVRKEKREMPTDMNNRTANAEVEASVKICL